MEYGRLICRPDQSPNSNTYAVRHQGGNLTLLSIRRFIYRGVPDVSIQRTVIRGDRVRAMAFIIETWRREDILRVC